MDVFHMLSLTIHLSVDIVGKVQEAYGYLKVILERGLSINQTSYHIVIGGYCNKGHMEDSFESCNVMMENCLTPIIVTCNTLINNFCKIG